MLMDSNILITGAAVFFARICDVSIGTVRTIATVQGKTVTAFILAVFEITIWVTVVSTVIHKIQNTPALVAFYALGYATGNAVGILMERKLAFGLVILKVFTRRSSQVMADTLREKGLRRVTGYAVPDNRHHEFNVAAWGEWTWNTGGRGPIEFSRAYARARAIADPALYAQWAIKAGDAGWWLAESRLFLRAIYDPRIALRKVVPTDFRFEKSDLLYERPQIEASLAVAEEALELAYRLRDRLDR